MTLTYDDIKPFLDAGAASAADILTAMQADRRRLRNIYVTGGPQQRDRLKHILGAQYGLFRKTLGNVFAGPIADWGKDPARTDNERAVVELLASYWDDSEAMFYCAENVVDGWALDLLATVGVGVLGAEAGAALVADIDRISGGWKWAGVTEAAIEAVIVAENRRVWAAAVRTRADNAAEAAEAESRKSDSTQASIEAAAAAVWGA